MGADVLLRNILRRALREAGLPLLRFHDLSHLAASFMVAVCVDAKRTHELLGHASERTTLGIYTHTLRRKHDDTGDKIAALAGLVPSDSSMGNNPDTSDSVESEESRVSD